MDQDLPAGARGTEVVARDRAQQVGEQVRAGDGVEHAKGRKKGIRGASKQ